MTTPQGIPDQQIADASGKVTGPWYTFFLNLLNRSGGSAGNPSSILDGISDIPGSILFRASQFWQGLTAGSAGTVLISDGAGPEWGMLSGANFEPQGQSDFLAGPLVGTGTPGFRQVASADLGNVAGQFPGTTTNDNATASHVGEYLFTEVDIGAAVPMSSGIPIDIASRILTPGDWDVWATFVTNPAGTTTQSDIRAWISTTSATDPGPPNAGAYAELRTAIAAGLSQTLAVGMRRVTVSSAGDQIAYLSANATFGTSTLSGYGFLGARRPR